MIKASAARFKHEARLLAQVRHPNLVEVRELDTSSIPWIVYEPLAGPSLHALRAGRALPVKTAVAAVCQLLSALEALHAAGFVHRVIKSQRLVQDRDGVWKLVGLRSAAAPGTIEWSVVGTPAYMAPEACVGEPHTTASDLYSAGVVLYEALAGRVPFKGQNLHQTVMMHLHEPPAPPSKHAEVPRWLDELALRALAKAPGDRFASARAFREALEAR